MFGELCKLQVPYYDPKFSEACWLRHVCLSVRMEKFGFHWMDLYEIWYLWIFGKSAEKVQI